MPFDVFDFFLSAGAIFEKMLPGLEDRVRGKASASTFVERDRDFQNNRMGDNNKPSVHSHIHTLRWISKEYHGTPE